MSSNVANWEIPDKGQFIAGKHIYKLKIFQHAMFEYGSLYILILLGTLWKQIGACWREGSWRESIKSSKIKKMKVNKSSPQPVFIGDM